MPHPTLLFSIDGMRPDALLQAKTPVIDRLIREGAHTLVARTVMPSVTLPCHTSLFRGVDVARHGITTNVFTPLARPVPSVLDVATAHGRTCGMFHNWGPLRDIAGPDSFRFAYLDGKSTETSDERVAYSAAAHIVGGRLDFAFVYLGFTDTVGHDHGWMSEPQIRAIENADRCVGIVLEACADAGLTPNVLLQSDHGGHDRSHGTEMHEDMTIPWVLWGPRARPGHMIQESVRIYDSGPTLAALLEVPQTAEWDGRPIHDALSPSPI